MANPTTPTPVKSEPIQGPPESRPPYSAYSQHEKWLIVTIIALAGLFSPLTANIYFPAIPTLSKAFNKSTELINLTVTMYMVLQGLAPMVWGALSDNLGRRPIYAACLLVLSLSCVGLALVPTSDYWLLMLLRCFQAAGSASTIALGAGVIGDISTREERGGFFGLFTLGPMAGPAIGPVIGGLLADNLGWRSIFWFLCIGSSVCLLMIILSLPETLRALVGDGSITPPSALYRPLFPVIGKKIQLKAANPHQPPTRFRNPLLLLLQLDLLNLLGISAIACAVFYAVLATISTLFRESYPFLNETKIGLCFLGIGGGMIIGSSVMGKFLDWEYASIKRAVSKSGSDSPGDTETSNPSRDTEGMFPIEQARLRRLPLLFVIYIGGCVGYGWCLQHRVHISVPLLLQILNGSFAIAILNSVQTLMVDLMHTHGSSVTACNNLVRCTLSAIVVAVIDLIARAVGPGWTYVIIGAISITAIPMTYLGMHIGPKWRMKRQLSSR